jgi:hypothetical protein
MCDMPCMFCATRFNQGECASLQAGALRQLETSYELLARVLDGSTTLYELRVTKKQANS